MNTHDTPEEMRDLFLHCAEIVRAQGKDSVPMTALALSFGLVWRALTEEQAAEYFDDLASHYDDPDRGRVVRMPTRGRRDGRWGRWFS